MVKQGLHDVLRALAQGCGWTLQSTMQGRVAPIVHGIGTDTTGQEQLHNGRMATATGQVQGPLLVLVGSIRVSSS